MQKPQITTYYADGRPPETREMTDEEIAAMPEPTPIEGTDETPSDSVDTAAQ
jgi:hypothetical protein